MYIGHIQKDLLLNQLLGLSEWCLFCLVKQLQATLWGAEEDVTPISITFRDHRFTIEFL